MTTTSDEPVGPPTLHIKLGRTGIGTVVLNGRDISNAVTAIVPAALRPGDLTEVALHVLAELDMEFDEPRLILPEASHDALVRMGWTPPEASGASGR